MISNIRTLLKRRVLNRGHIGISCFSSPAESLVRRAISKSFRIHVGLRASGLNCWNVFRRETQTVPVPNPCSSFLASAMNEQAISRRLLIRTLEDPPAKCVLETQKIASIASPKLIHQSKDAFANLKQLFPSLRDLQFRQNFFRNDRFQSGLRFVQMIQRSF
ncbi:MAG: hypothetical protein JWM99_1533 [Verrucomicrobiales bacterium]|nr:hypothetical protein [Verrucomicrobiales bacterium]